MGARVNDDWLCHEDDHSCYIGRGRIVSGPDYGGAVWLMPDPYGRVAAGADGKDDTE